MADTTRSTFHNTPPTNQQLTCCNLTQHITFIHQGKSWTTLICSCSLLLSGLFVSELSWGTVPSLPMVLCHRVQGNRNVGDLRKSNVFAHRCRRLRKTASISHNAQNYDSNITKANSIHQWHHVGRSSFRPGWNGLGGNRHPDYSLNWFNFDALLWDEVDHSLCYWFFVRLSRNFQINYY